MFLQEQGISKDLVFDGYDKRALHILVKDGERVIGSARVQFLANNQTKLGGMIILKHYRRKGIGSETFLFIDTVLKDKQV